MQIYKDWNRYRYIKNGMVADILRREWMQIYKEGNGCRFIKKGMDADI